MLKDLFHSMDHDGGGVLDQQELRALSLTLGYKVRPRKAAPHSSVGLH
jgi:Ca2+-binding EF-hand superfamily protein